MTADDLWFIRATIRLPQTRSISRKRHLNFEVLLRMKYSVIWWRHYVIPWYTNSIKATRDCFPWHGRLVGLTRSRCLSFNRALGYLQRVSGPQILRESRRRIEDTTEPKKEEKKMGNNFFVLELKLLILNNYYLTQLVPFPMYCHILIIIIVITWFLWDLLTPKTEGKARSLRC